MLKTNFRKGHAKRRTTKDAKIKKKDKFKSPTRVNKNVAVIGISIAIILLA